jgi:hypothetical protein
MLSEKRCDDITGAHELPSAGNDTNLNVQCRGALIFSEVFSRVPPRISQEAYG